MTNPRRQSLEEPDMGHRRGQLDMPHALAAHLALGHLDAALVAHDAAVLHALELAAQALPVGDRAEDLGAEQAVFLRLEGPVVDGLGLGDLAVGPAADLFRAGERDLDRLEIIDGACAILEWRALHQGQAPFSSWSAGSRRGTDSGALERAH